MFKHHPFRMAALGGIVLSLLMLGSPWAAFAASGWSPGVVISPTQPSPTPSAFAIDPAGHELWVAAPPVAGGYAIEVAQRTFGGTWSPQTTIFSSTNRFVATVNKIYVSIGANNTASVAWQVGFAVLVALRSPSGIWQAPVTISPGSGTANSLVAKADAQGNGVAVWSQMTNLASAVDAVTWTASGVFSNVTQLSGFAPSELMPYLAVNEAGTAIATFAQATTPGGSTYQTYSATRPAGGNWSAATPVTPNAAGSITGVALDSSGDATVLLQQGTSIASSTRPNGGSWSSPTILETATIVVPASVVSDAAGNLTAVWAVNSGNGVTSVHAATRLAGSFWGTPANLGACSSQNCVPLLAAARDGSIAVVSFIGASNGLNVAVRLGLGTWTPAVVISSFSQLTNLVAGNNAFASAVWTTGIHVKYHVALVESDFR
ncbi:MAG: hypothetical protein ACXWM8_02570 [Candidatus Limnocylindrales bacterium]